MKYRLMDVLKCPNCSSELSLIPFVVNNIENNINLVSKEPYCDSRCAWMEQFSENKSNCIKCMSIDIELGIMLCKNNHFFPIIRSIPRLFENSINVFYNNLQPHLTKLTDEIKNHLNKSILNNDDHFQKKFLHTQESFSSEWEHVGSDERAWGRSSEERKNLFIQSFDIEFDNLYGKKLFDAGCGHGEVEQALIDSGLEIFAMDLSFSVDQIQNQLNKLSDKGGSYCYLVQGNIHSTPFKNGVFDFVHSAGVLHHTPDTLKGFRKITKCLKLNGLCFIELYSTDHKNSLDHIIYYINNLIRKISIKIPHKLLHFICFLATPWFWVYINLFNVIINKNKYIKRTLRELELSLFDALSPIYAWHHTTDEVKDWFQDVGYIKIKKTFSNHNGIGIVGKLKNNILK